MTILRNKFFVGQEVYDLLSKETVTILGIERDTYLNILMCKIQTNSFTNWRKESDLMESKEAYEKQKNEIREGDEFYYLFSPFRVVKKIAVTVDDNVIEDKNGLFSKEHCYKTKELLLAAVQKAVEACE